MVKVKFSPREEQNQFWFDNLYGSGEWNAGDVREVEDWIAASLLRHDDMFSDARHHKQREQPIDATRPVVKEKDEDESELAPLVQIDTMTKEQVATFAKRQFGIDLQPSLKKGEMIEKVRFLMGRK